MRRPLLFVIGLFALLWTVAARPPVVDVASGFSRTSASAVGSLDEGGPGSRSSAEACAVTGTLPGTGDPSQQWHAHHDAIVPVTESVWTSAPVHAALAATRTPRLFAITLAVSVPDPPSASVPSFLRHTPLLI